jgi:hypothetical protein
MYSWCSVQDWLLPTILERPGRKAIRTAFARLFDLRSRVVADNQ